MQGKRNRPGFVRAAIIDKRMRRLKPFLFRRQDHAELNGPLGHQLVLSAEISLGVGGDDSGTGGRKGCHRHHRAAYGIALEVLTFPPTTQVVCIIEKGLLPTPPPCPTL